MQFIPLSELRSLRHTAPFWLALTAVPFAVAAALWGGWWIALLPLYAWQFFWLMDFLTGNDLRNADPETPTGELFWYRAITIIWFPVQTALLAWTVWYVSDATHLNLIEKFAIFASLGVVTGAVGINFAHELMHKTSRLERVLADLLLASVLYSHFRSEHLLVHHIHACTPKDAATARYNEGFHRFFARVIWQVPRSAFRAEASRQTKLGRRPFHRSNPFWRYAGYQLCALMIAFAIGGGLGLMLFVTQAIVAFWQRELVNYIEHYGLVRKQVAPGRFEPFGPHHAWNSVAMASGWFLINMHRHADHHVKPARPFPLLQTYAPEDAPLMPFGYPLMTLMAVVPPIWRRVMNPRVRAWRRQHYPDVTQWQRVSRADKRTA